MGHDIDIILYSDDKKTYSVINNLYITFNFSKLGDKYPGIYAIHGHKLPTIIKILRKTIDLLMNDGIFPYIEREKNKDYKFDWIYGDKDPIMNLKYYAGVLLYFLEYAFKLKENYPNEFENIYWYSDQVWEISKYTEENYESDGLELDSESEEPEEFFTK